MIDTVIIAKCTLAIGPDLDDPARALDCEHVKINVGTNAATPLANNQTDCTPAAAFIHKPATPR